MSVILKAISMVRPSKDHIQAPTGNAVEISNDDFAKMADTAKSAKVSFDADGVSNPADTTVYRNRFGGQFIQAWKKGE